MRRISVIVLLAVAVLAGSLTLTSANASSDSFRLISVTKQTKDVDVGPKGPSLGDFFVFSDNVYEDKRRVGTLDGVCHVTRLTGKTGRQQCVATRKLRDGLLTAQTAFAFDPKGPLEVTLAITGGTGRYSDAGGEAHVKFLSDTRARIDVVLN